MHDGIGTASMPEIIMTLGAGIGLYYVVRVTHPRAASKQTSLQALGENGIAQRSTGAVLFGEQTRGFIFTIMLIIGVMLMTIPSNTQDGNPAPAAWFLMSGFLIIQAALHLWSWNDTNALNDMLRMAKARREREESLIAELKEAQNDTV